MPLVALFQRADIDWDQLVLGISADIASVGVLSSPPVAGLLLAPHRGPGGGMGCRFALRLRPANSIFHPGIVEGAKWMSRVCGAKMPVPAENVVD